MRSLRKKREIKKERFTALWYILGLALLFSGFVVYSAIQMSAIGAKIANLEKEERILLSKNNELSDSLVCKTSLLSISENADEMGFVKPENVIYTEKEEFAAKLP